jgi:pimeloyl-ACP methyl ester carboxylesterase
VTFKIQNVGGLVDYADDYLQHPPVTGAPSLKVSNLWNIGGTYYAVALFEAPAVAPSSQGQSYASGVTATQSGIQQASSVNLVLPPVVLVHGLWGDATSLSDMQSYLDGAGDWYKQYVAPICYSKYLAFDARKDPLSTGKDPCEVTSRDALETEINSMLATLDADRVSAGRVDLVAHSMGGLVLRNYASQSGYASFRNRVLGQFHTTTTLNTPEIGSRLANFLIKHRDDTRQASLFTVPGAVYYALCQNADVKSCFASLGYPLYGPGLSVGSGAVHSLEPGSKDLTNPALLGPNVANTEWLAISSLAPGNSALATGINTLIAAVYSDPNSAPDINSILKTNQNDAIVTLRSQTQGAVHGQVVTEQKLSHTYLVGSLLTLLTGGQLNDDNVLQDPGTAKIAGCWLQTAGTGSCFAPGSHEAPVASAPVPNIKVIDGIRIRAPRNVELGKPFEIAVRSRVPGSTPKLTVFQESNLGTRRIAAIRRVRVTGDTAYATVTPMFPGAVTFGIGAHFDGAVAIQKVQLNVRVPAAAPLAFRANTLPRLVLVLGDGTRAALPRPVATYAAPVGRVFLNGDLVRYRLMQRAGAPAVRISPDGTIDALHAGKATIEGRFGKSVDRFDVIVRAKNQ